MKWIVSAIVVIFDGLVAYARFKIDIGGSEISVVFFFLYAYVLVFSVAAIISWIYDL